MTKTENRLQPAHPKHAGAAAWICRILLLLLLPPLFYAALVPSFVASQVVPHGFLYRNGVPYSAVLWFELHFGEIFHLLAALILMLLLPASKVLFIRSTTINMIGWGILLGLAAPVIELIQWATGRGFDSSDLLFHYVGMMLAACIWLTSFAVNRHQYPVPDL